MAVNRTPGPLLEAALKRCFGAPFGVYGEHRSRHGKSRYRSRVMWRGRVRMRVRHRRARHYAPTYRVAPVGLLGIKL
jgi:hypothetical protein